MARRQSSPTRVLDSDRVHARTHLDAAHADGRLTDEEWRNLVARAETAQTLPELANLVRDLRPPADA